ncbi:MMPL family transporter [Actinomadura sp. NTSP31]|uniref:MMPL family transporter n=1 Tax=Actinomadura sp. NTSP31 TaxID=1735447 RepID=UPI0035C0F1E0
MFLQVRGFPFDMELGMLPHSAIAPLLLLGAVVLSTGASILAFHAAGLPRTDPSVLTLGLLFMLALGVDYTVFLMGRAREKVARHGRGGRRTARAQRHRHRHHRCRPRSRGDLPGVHRVPGRAEHPAR